MAGGYERRGRYRKALGPAPPDPAVDGVPGEQLADTSIIRWVESGECECLTDGRRACCVYHGEGLASRTVAARGCEHPSGLRIEARLVADLGKLTAIT